MNSFQLRDNHPAHYVQQVIERVYSDLNSIEEALANVKHNLRLNDLVRHAVGDPGALIWNAFAGITSDDCLEYMHHAGYI